jgi:hypothetical protein
VASEADPPAGLAPLILQGEARSEQVGMVRIDVSGPEWQHVMPEIGELIRRTAAS